MGQDCNRNSWIAAAVLGAIVFLLIWIIGSAGFFGGLLIGAAVAIVLGFFFTMFLCGDTADDAEAVGLAPTTAAAASAARSTPDAAPRTANAASDAEADAVPATAATVDAVETDEATEAEVAEPAPAPEPEPAAEPDTATTEPTPEPEADAPAEEPAVEEPAPAPPPKAPAPQPATAAPEGDGTKPAGLDSARDGQPDDLKRIKGVGPKLEIMLNDMGFYHFDQIAGWDADEIAWVDQNLKGFKGRVTRDNWVDQAAQLASGQETEFSKRVDDGDVY